MEEASQNAIGRSARKSTQKDLPQQKLLLARRRGLGNEMSIKLDLARAVINDEDLTELHYTSEQLDQMFCAATPSPTSSSSVQEKTLMGLQY